MRHQLLPLIWICSVLLPSTGAQLIQFVDTQVIVEEGNHFDLRIRHVGDIVQMINVIVNISGGNIDQDFIGGSQVAYFTQGGSDVTSVTFTVTDDDEPEIEETYMFELHMYGGGATVTVPNIATVIIVANDDAYGFFSFLDASPLITQEDAVITHVINIQIGRDLGTFGRVTVTFRVEGTAATAVAGDDITPQTGGVIFQPGEMQNFIQLQIHTDTIPENDEEFSVTLTSATQGARVTSEKFLIVIGANDAPIRFTRSEYRVDEVPVSKSVPLIVTRGLDIDGTTRIGSVAGTASVNYRLLPGSAIPGEDFIGSDGEVRGVVAFAAGQTSAIINMEIIDDGSPEMEESFQVLLSSPVGDVILSTPDKVEIFINASDNPNGVLSMRSPDFISPPSFQVNEDTNMAITFTVERTAGSFGEVSVSWEVGRNDSGAGDGSQDLTPTMGTVTFTSGQRERSITIGVIRDTIPEPAERFFVRLLPETATNGATVKGIKYGIVLIEDSDNMYGIVQFDVTEKQKLLINADPRMLQLGFSRLGANFGDLHLNLTVKYIPIGDENTDVLEETEVATVLFAGQSEFVEHIHIQPSAFLQVGGVFTARITAAFLVTEPDLGAFNSPILGPRTSTTITVTSAEANGEIGFHKTVPMVVSEPPGSPTQVELKLSREGTSGEATISWVMQGTGASAMFVTEDDVGAMSGTVVMRSGMSETSVVITVMPDDKPEINEELSVTLTGVVPASSQRLKVGATTRTLVISENDNPGGIFQFATTEGLSYTLQEGGTRVELTVQRYGGDLMEKSIQYVIVDGQPEFYGYTNVLTFPPGVKSRKFSVAAIPDGIPELEEIYTLKLQTYGDNDNNAAIGSRSTVALTISENDFPYGVIQIRSSSLTTYINESKAGISEVATVTVDRLMGLFGSVQVTWSVDPGDEVNLRPLTGVITFNADQDVSFIRLESVPDDLYEVAQSFTLTLSDPTPTGSAVIGQSQTATVIINENDYPIYFIETTYSLEEPSEIQIQLRRDGPTDRITTVKYRTIDNTARAISDDYESVLAGEITFNIGEVQKSIEVRILDDGEAEGPEVFYLKIYELIGDVVMTGPEEVTITILDNDEAYGIFHFMAPFSWDVEEGSTVTYQIVRDGGSYGGVEVFYEIYNTMTNQRAVNGGDFNKAEGLSVNFEKGEILQTIDLTPRIDNEPEKEITYSVVLTGVDVFDGRTDVPLTRIGDQETSVFLTILASDDPNGRFGFPLEAREMSVAEDYYPGMASTAQVSIAVDRRMGLYGTVEVAWEVYSDRVAGALPRCYDLVFLGTIPSTFMLVPSERRPHTGTHVVLFTGVAESHVSVAAMYQPTKEDIADGFTITAWVQPYANTDGYIMAKTNPDGSRHFYTLRMITASFGTQLEFGYSSTGSNENMFQSVTYQRNIEDTLWHHVVVTVATEEIKFYIDSTHVGSRSMMASQVIFDNTGRLTVGAIGQGAEQFSGYMQDVRIYSRKLNEEEILELYELPAGDDVTPISGYITYTVGMRDGSIDVRSIQDSEEESNEVFTVKLLSAKGGATISDTDYAATLTVLKSDNANGLFAIPESCQPARPTQEDITITCMVLRQRGDDGTVRVTWAVYQLISGQEVLADADFTDYTGSVVFEPGLRTSSFSVTLKSDGIPELEETFVIRLLNTTTDDGQSGSTDTSGASIDQANGQSQVVVKENDYPYGLLQFSGQNIPPLPNDPFIPPATEQPVVRVSEESGLVRLLVVRAQGYQGQVTVEWRTTDGTARSSGKTPADYSPGVGRLTLHSGERYGYIVVTILDNDIPEDEKMFFVTLLNPSGGAVLGVGSAVTVMIDHSDGAFGVFQFADSALGVQAEEMGDTGFNIVLLQVVRTGGSIGETHIEWEVQGDQNNDIVDQKGTVTFSHGQMTSSIGLKVRGDIAPELDELFIVQLTNVSRGELGDAHKVRSEVTVLANDDPYGVFIVPDTQRPRIVEETNTLVTLTVQRVGGTYGTVELDYATLAATETFPYIPAAIPRADFQDFTMTSASVRFIPGQEVATFDLQILDDVEPEENEAVYVRLTGIRLLEGAQIRPIDNSPRLGFDSETYGQVIISYNDNANGELVLSPLSPRIPEGQTEPFLFVTRYGGAFGEVSVTIQVTDGSALHGLDYVLTTNEVRLGRGETSVAVPLQLVDDDIPEVAETFSVTLDQVSGGGVLGTVTSTTVTIETSDDPNGAFEFLLDGVSVEEPDGQPLSVNVTVVRTGGSLGVVTLGWAASLNGEPANEDISPTAGSVFFVSNEVGRQIVINVLPDDVPEGQEDIQVQLLTVDSGGRIGDRATFTLSILPNDNPHGVIQLGSASYTVVEQATTAVQQLALVRSGGSFGQLRVYYSTEAVTSPVDISASTGDVLDYYSNAQLGSRGIVGEDVIINIGEDATQVCATACLQRIYCQSFEVTPDGDPAICSLFPSATSQPLTPGPSTYYYIKDEVMAGQLTGLPATPGDDYQVVTNGYVLIDAGVMESSLPLSIIGDTVPELDEKFVVRLTRVDVTGEPPGPQNSPYLGERRTATVTILANDDTYGVFRLYSDSLQAIDNGQVIAVEEKSQLAVDLIVERAGGSIGEVSVQWSVDQDRSTAVYGIDYVADGATLSFIPGETRKLITVTVLDDTVPEDRKFIVVQLTNSVGGANIGVGMATIIVLENDYLAGVLSLSTTSLLANEGDTISVDVTRAPAQHGTVTTDWSIRGLNAIDPSTGFQQYQGSLTFLPGEARKTIVLDVLTDNMPEVDEEYQLDLLNIQTQDVGVTGAAVYDPLFRSASITIEGSNNPHGVVQFGSNSLNVRVSESSGPVSIQLDRKFGAIGTIRVQYSILQGSVSLTNDELILATPNEDFVAMETYLDIGDGVSSAAINVEILEDELPEVDEVFIVELSSVALVNSAATTFPPLLGSSGTVSQVIINANDGTKGIAKFAPDSSSVAVDEVSRTMSLTVLRERGTFGEVSVFFYAQSVIDGTNLGLDFKIVPEELFFRNGEDNKQILIEIVNDDLPEPDEMFEVILSNPKNGLQLGDPSRATVTILANDDSRGFVYFESVDLVTVEEPGRDNAALTSAQLVIVRGPGMYGVVNVPFEVVPEFAENTGDLSPVQGSVTFQDLQTSVTLTLNVLDDELPEDAERFTVRLLEPDNTAKLGTRVERTLVISPNDSPNGLFSLFAAGTRQREISVEEGVGLLQFDIVRTQGMEGTVTVAVATEPGTAESTADVAAVSLVPVQVMPANNVKGWSSFDVNGTVYMLMIKANVVGELTSELGSNGSAGAIDMSELTETTLFRWQGELTPVQTVETDGASAASSFVIDHTHYLFITNMGNHARYQVHSRLYRVNEGGILTLIQDLPTVGATDATYFTWGDVHYLVIANSIDNTGTSHVKSDLWRWEPENKRFILISPLNTLGASGLAVFQIEGAMYLAVANNYDSVEKTYQVDSKIYKLGTNDQFSQHQSIPTLGAIDVAYFRIRSLDLLIFANNRDNTISSPQKSDVYRWDTATQMFLLHERLETNRVQSVGVFLAFDDTVYAVFANGIASSVMFAWDVQSSRFQKVWTGPPAFNLHPVTIRQTSGDINLVAVASRNISVYTSIQQLIKVKDSDFAPRTITMTMDQDQDLLHTTVMVLQDTVPEDTETFYVTLRDPTGGADVGPNNRIAVNILSNDNAHGVIEIADDSLELRVNELAGRDNTVQVNVMRQQGYFGHVTVKWTTSGDHNGIDDITPLTGMVEFEEGQSVATISLTIRDDDIAELQEVTYVQLASIVETGTPLPGRGAQIGVSRTAKVVVLPNDSPYGVVRWERTTYTVMEPEGTDATVILYIVREQGLTGELQVTYITSTDNSSPRYRQAISGEDYVARQGVTFLQEGITRVAIEVVVKQDAIPEAAEVFLVNITQVKVMGVDVLPGAEPSIGIPGNVVMVTISENDNARGIVQFNVSTNIEGRIDVYEQVGMNTSVSLQVTRTIGFFGAVTITWQADPREATIMDFSPASGTLTLSETQENANIYITVIDDSIPEEMETFDIKLISVTGGALIGPTSSVRIAILKNDSPNGLFRFVTTESIVRESTSPVDPDGEVRLIVERIQGSEGVVDVQWRLNAEASYDFYEPHSGTMSFAQGEKTKSLLLRTKPDTILEGREEFRVSLITADNNADISHTQGDSTIVILPDPGASGTISIVAEYRRVYIGEPGESDPSYNGKVPVVLTRGDGIYGDISVSWSITPRDESAFLQLEGSVNIVDLQQKATIILQALDDTTPELRTVYTLQINSATGGALISQITGATMSDIVFVASDYPHGDFAFDLPQTVIVTEDQHYVSVPVLRRMGLNGQVLVMYATRAGTAAAYEDYYPLQGTLTFQHGENRQIIDVQLRPDDDPEGLELFYLTLTSARLLFPSNNNYSSVDKLQLDMAPSIGSLNTKEIMIEKNDNAEGTIEFLPEAIDYFVTEETGVARLPLIRRGGNFGRVSVFYSTQNETATEGVDYVLPTGEVVFDDHVQQTTINITVRDDSEMEYEETFLVQLISTTGGALLGQTTSARVIIAKSDYPNGRFAFRGQQKFELDNPANQIQQMFSVERTGGLLGQQTVYWRILGPNNPGAVLEETNDIAYIFDGRELTSGSLVWADGQAGERTFTLDIKPFSTWEIEKVFVVELYRVVGFPLSAGSGEASPTRGTLSITISKFGDPNGIVRFQGPAQAIREVAEPDGTATLTLQFPLKRRQDTGTVGNIQIHWELRGSVDDLADIQPQNGSVLIADEERMGEIVIEVLPDDVPELTETFTLVITGIVGGAEIDSEYVTSTFRILHNDQPHGVFGIIPQYQTVIVNPEELTRHVQLNFTRHAGTFGSVILTFGIKYDVPRSGIVLSLNDGTVTFADGDTHRVVTLGIDGTGFLKMGTTFSVSLIEVQYLGAGVTDPPTFRAGQTMAKVEVPAVAANSEVGFEMAITSVNEEYSTSTLTIIRRGLYGTLDVAWQSGFPSGEIPDTFTEGVISPSSSTVTIPHGEETRDFTVELTAKIDVRELFAVYLPSSPSTTVAGGARLLPDKSKVRIEPYGVVRFADNSTGAAVSEMFGKVYLQVIRLYGSEAKVEASYRAVGVSASAGLDYKTIENHAVVMEPGETSALIMIEVMQDNKPEEAEIFHVNLTNVEKFPTDTSPSISPRLSYLYQSSVVTIKESNDPYGILCLEPEITAVEERFQQVNLTVRRTGGIFGTVRVLVRTVGGGEDWTSQIVPKPGADSNNTITEILGNRDPLSSADGRTDYVILNTEIEFKQGETTKTVQLTVLADDMAEPDETVLVYLTQPTGGARIAAGEPDGGKKGYAVVYISQNDLSNGKIGFSEDSKQVSANEDLSPTFALKLARTEAFFGEVEISWVAKVGETSTEVEDVVLSSQLERTAGTAICPRRHANCFFNISLVNDEIPEEESSFVVKLVSVENDAQLNEASLFAHITVASSDYIRGLIEFTDDSSIVVVSRYAESVRLKVSRRGGQEYRVEASYRTSQMVSQDARAGITLYPALEGEDYSGRTGTLVFEAERQDLQYIDVNLTPTRASTNPYPKQFYVELRNPSNGALINTENYRAAVMVVQDVDIWNIIINKGDKPLTDDEIRDIIAELDALIQTSRPMTDNEVTLVENILKDIIDEGLNRKLPTQIISQVINVMCKMLTPNKDDATRGRFTLAEIMENIAYMMVAETPCPSPNPPDLLSLQCVHAKVAAGRWPLGNIQGFQYAAQHQDNLRVPNKITDAPVTGETQCLDFHIIEYMSEQWFQQGAQNVLLSNKVLSFGVKDRPSSYTDVPMTFRINSPDRRIATRKAQCVYFDIALRSWVGPKEVCEVTNNLDLGVDSFVDCSCKHLTHYAVQAVTSDAGIVGYTIWFYIACFICMAGLILAILAHHACSISAMVSSSLLMHMCFAALATQICYVVAAYVSPDEILVYTLDDDNYRCIVMGLFLHYFFLAQFSWMMTQAVNFWKILVLNDEHTDRKYVLFFLLGWGVPVVILAIFYVVTFNLYKYVYDLPTDFIYGDVNNNGDLCFIPNAYAALAGVIIPVLLMFTVVAVVFVKAFQVTPQWQAYDDIYRGRYNIKEVRTILMFWAVIILTWLWGSLHLVYGHLWMLIMFCIFNIIQGIMALVLYALLRNPCLMQCFAPQKASSYAVTAGLFEPTHLPHQHGSNAGQYQFHPSTLDAGSLKGSRASLLNESWERDSLPTSRPSTMKVKRTLPHSGNIYIDPPVLRQGAESDTKDFDDLLFALKTGRSFTPSDGNSLDSDKLSDISSKVDKYELRRIDIADTHL